MKRLPEDIANKLLEASTRLEGTNLDVSIDGVAQLADIPRATFYYYVSGKHDLVGFFLADKLNRASVAAKQAIGEDVSNVPEARFVERIRGNAEHLMTKHGAKMVRFRVETIGGQVNLAPVVIH